MDNTQESLHAWIARHGVIMESSPPLPGDPNMHDDAWAKLSKAQHYQVMFSPGEGPSTFFSVGGGIVDAFALKAAKKAHRGYQWKGLSPRCIAYDELLAPFRLKYRPDCVDVLNSLKMDMPTCDQSFEEWCFDLGMDTDSRKALATYLVCQKSARDLRNWISRQFGAGAWADFLDCENL